MQAGKPENNCPPGEEGHSPARVKTVCDLGYLASMMGGKTHLMKGMIDIFLVQVPEELGLMNEAVEKAEYSTIKSIAHTMKSSVSIMGISLAGAVLKEMEALGSQATGIEKIKELNQSLHAICRQAIEELGAERINHI